MKSDKTNLTEILTKNKFSFYEEDNMLKIQLENLRDLLHLSFSENGTLTNIYLDKILLNEEK